MTFLRRLFPQKASARLTPKIDTEVFNQAIQGYLKDTNKRESVLAEYAPMLRVERKVREVLGIWL